MNVYLGFAKYSKKCIFLMILITVLYTVGGAEQNMKIHIYECIEHILNHDVAN